MKTHTTSPKDSPLAALALFMVTLLGLGGSIAGLGVLSLQRPAAALLPPVQQLPWTMSLLPEDEVGEAYTFSGTMVLPEGLEPGQQVNMTVYYSESPTPVEDAEFLDALGLVRPASMPPFSIASQLQYEILSADGSSWGFQLDLVSEAAADEAISAAVPASEEEPCRRRVML